jgi:hypothetical protein
MSNLRDNNPPLGPPKKIAWGICDLWGLAHIATSRAANDRQLVLLLHSLPSRKLGWTSSAAINLTGGKGFHSKIGIRS